MSKRKVPMTVEALKARGYCRISNRYRSVARIDDPQWLTRTARALGRSVKALINEGVGSAADWYRRCLSKDVIDNVPLHVFKLIPGSGHNPTGFMEVDDDNGRS